MSDRLTRRDFLKLLGLSGTAVGLGWWGEPVRAETAFAVRVSFLHGEQVLTAYCPQPHSGRALLIDDHWVEGLGRQSARKVKRLLARSAWRTETKE